MSPTLADFECVSEQQLCSSRKKGRPRCEKAKQAILDATLDLLQEHGCCHHCLTMEAIAKRAAVGKQTVYKWWGGTADILLEILCDNAADKIPDFSCKREVSLQEFLSGTFASLTPTIKVILKVLMAEAILNEKFRKKFVEELLMVRREALGEILRQTPQLAEVEQGLAVDFIFGLMWYRLLMDVGPLGDKDAKAIAAFFLT